MNTEELRRFVLERLEEDEKRLAEEKLPLLDEAEGRGRLRIIRSDDGSGLLLLPGPIQAAEERVPVPFPEKFGLLRTEVCINDPTDVGVRKSLVHLDYLRRIADHSVTRFQKA